MYVKGLVCAVLLLVGFFSAGTASAAYYEVSEIGSQWETTTASRLQAETAGYAFNYGDEDKVVYSLPWSFLYYGQSYSQIVADSNGNVWFAPADPDNLPNTFDLTTTGPVIAAWNSDLTSYSYGGVFVEHKTSPERVVVEWQVETFASQSSAKLNKIQAVLYQDGRVQLNYGPFGDIAGTDAGSGLSKGDGVEVSNVTQLFDAVPGLQGRSFLVEQYVPLTFGIDNIAVPVTAQNYTVAGDMYSGATVTASIDTTAVIGPVTYPSATGWQFEVQQLIEGDNNLQVSMAAVDGSVQSAAAKVTLETGAVVYGVTPYATPTSLADFTLSGTMETGATVVVTDAASGQQATIIYPTTRSWQASFTALADGEHNLAVNVSDAFGNTATENLLVTVDTIPPSLTIDPVTTPTGATGQTVTGTMEDGASVSASIDSGATVGSVNYPTATTWSVEVTNLKDGENTVTVIATDSAGNTTTNTALIECLPDTDGDGIPDRDDDDIDNDGIPNDWETSNGLDPYNVADAVTDLDDDNLNNRLEYIMGFDPWNVDSDFDGANDGAEFWGMMVPVIFNN